MKITSVGTSPLMRHGILPGFRKLGFDTSSFPFQKWNSLSEAQGTDLLKKYILAAKTDYLLFAGYAPKYFCHLPTFCKENGIAFIYWAIEDPIGFEQTLFLAKESDLLFTTTAESIEEYKKRGIKAHLLTFACNPDYHKTGVFQTEYKSDLVLAASCYYHPARLNGLHIILEAAKEIKAKEGASLQVWGAGWETHLGKKILQDPSLYCGYFPNKRLPDLCASAKIVLGIQCDDSSMTQTSMRPYEILGCRGFHLTQWTKATENIFQDGKHLVTAKSKEEAVEKIAYYLNHPEQREKIAQQGQDFVYRYHTYEKRIKENILPYL